jgi:SAM-dependent methyltransferase
MRALVGSVVRDLTSRSWFNMHGTNVDIGDLLSEARPLPASSVSILRCPACGRTPRTQSFGAGYALSECRCGAMPTAEGVLLAQPDETRERVTAAIRSNRHDVARKLVLGKHAPRVRAMESLGIPVTFSRFTRHRILAELIDRTHLRPALERLGAAKIAHRLAAASLFNDYLRHRYCAPALLSAIPLLGLTRDHDADEAPVLDAPCGMGHLASLLAKIIPQERIVCIDLLPYFAYAARRFFAPDAKFTIAYDMSRPLPLADESFGTIFCLDAIQYIPNKPRVAAEFMRVLRDDGVVAILHAQNRLVPNVYGGEALAPAEYAALFRGYHVRLYPESYMIDAFVQDRPLDLTRKFTLDQLSAEQAVHVIAAKSPEVFRVVEPVAHELLDQPKNERISPLYRVARNCDAYVFTRQLPEGLSKEYNRFSCVLPTKVRVPLDEVEEADGQLSFKKPRQLRRLGVLVDLPETY